MFQIHDMIMYGHAGVCQIADVTTRQFAGMDPQQYYVLTPVFDHSGTVYTPVAGAEAKLRPLISAEEVRSLITTMPKLEDSWIEDDSERQHTYISIIRRGEHRELIQLIMTIYRKREEKRANGRKLRNADEKLMLDAEKLLYQEFAVALHIAPQEVENYISTCLKSA